MHKGAIMMLCSFSCRVSFVACVECAEQMMACLELPFSHRHGTLVSNFLTAAKWWCQATKGEQQVNGVEAVKVLHAQVEAQLETGGHEPLLMKLGPFVQLLPAGQRAAVRKLIADLQDKPLALKRLGSKASLGMAKKKKIVSCSATASSASGASMKIDLFDYK